MHIMRQMTSARGQGRAKVRARHEVTISEDYTLETCMRSHLGHIGAGEDEPAGGRVLLHGAPEAVLGLARQPVHLIQQQHLVAALPL